MSAPPKGPTGPGAEDAGEGFGEPAGGGRAASLTGQVRKVLLGGASALLGAEDGLRGALSDVKLPKDAVRMLLHQVERTRDEVTKLVGREVKRAMRGADLRGELRRALLGMRIDVRASVRFREDKTSGGTPRPPGSPTVRLRTQVRRRRRRSAGPEDEATHGPQTTPPGRSGAAATVPAPLGGPESPEG